MDQQQTEQQSERCAWWRGAALYQVYPRSFADGDGDGTGDLAGLRARLPYLAELGVDALWISPWYVSPLADGGYDIADYRDIDPAFGTLAEAELLIAEAHDAGLRIVVDLVPNHCSDRHPWFRAALAAGPGSPERAHFHFRPGLGEEGELPPNDWRSHFGGPAWQRVAEPDGRPGEWYLHLFAPEQPDWNWENPEVRAEFASVLRFWLDRGVDGFRIDVTDHLVKEAGLPDSAGHHGHPDPWRDQDGVHAVYRDWRAITDGYPGERMFVAELWETDPGRFCRYLRPDELHAAFNFALLRAPWAAEDYRQVIDATFAAHAPVGAPPTWVLSNHDTTRQVTRFGRADTGYGFDRARRHGLPVDLALGTRRARAAALLVLALPGGVYVYQGDELGLWEVESIPDELRQDPVWLRTGGADRGRDGCRVPLPWGGSRSPFGFGPEGSVPWLDVQPAAWKDLSVAAQSGTAGSQLELYRAALRLRRAHPCPDDSAVHWLPSPARVLDFTRSADFRCLVNFGPEPVPLPVDGEPLLASGALTDGPDGPLLPADTAVWLRPASRSAPASVSASASTWTAVPPNG
ncbi:glycoside hydrolase family 13 protein [Streptacidiphilus albus]|uniref:glycoside hydrolase family 13 protein n=1 Tax=Streptacidiphilus albus TaxID=105425 RepID=UPI0005A96A73|nr:glycoside hydrolase family 13 protein [Streptacidiphilus albus]